MARLIVMFPVVAVIACAAPGINENCQWLELHPAGLNLSNPADQRHLWADVALAEDLAVRYADARTAPPRRWAVDECLSPLFGTIAHTHGVTVAQVLEARGHRNQTLDLAVLLGFAVFYGFVAWWIAGALGRRFAGEPLAFAVMSLAASVAVSAAGVALGEMWAILVEIFRIGNDHLGGRAFRIPWGHQRPELFVGAVLLFWLVSIVRFRRGAPEQLVTLARARWLS